MRQIVFHGPNNDDECRRFVRRLAKEWGGKFRYNSFFHARRGWFSDDTTGKAAYCVQMPMEKADRTGVAQLIRKARRVTGPVKFRTFY
jgi:hypothetical protein